MIYPINLAQLVTVSDVDVTSLNSHQRFEFQLKYKQKGMSKIIIQTAKN